MCTAMSTSFDCKYDLGILKRPKKRYCLFLDHGHFAVILNLRKHSIIVYAYSTFFLKYGNVM